jgi:hypothetical protein
VFAGVKVAGLGVVRLGIEELGIVGLWVAIQGITFLVSTSLGIVLLGARFSEKFTVEGFSLKTARRWESCRPVKVLCCNPVRSKQSS